MSWRGSHEVKQLFYIIFFRGVAQQLNHQWVFPAENVFFPVRVASDPAQRGLEFDPLAWEAAISGARFESGYRT